MLVLPGALAAQSARAVAVSRRRPYCHLMRSRAAVTTLVLGALAAFGGGAGCRLGEKDAASYQGVIEYEERDLAFEVPGRLIEIPVVEGDTLGAGAIIARLDDSLRDAARATRAPPRRRPRAIS